MLPLEGSCLGRQEGVNQRAQGKKKEREEGYKGQQRAELCVGTGRQEAREKGEGQVGEGECHARKLSPVSCLSVTVHHHQNWSRLACQPPCSSHKRSVTNTRHKPWMGKVCI